MQRVVRLLLQRVPGPALRLQREHLHLHAVQNQLDLMRLIEPFDHFIPIPRQPELDVVLPVPRKVVGKHRAAARAERQPVHVLLLRPIRRHHHGRRPRKAHRTPHGQPADLLRRRDVALQQGRRQARQAHVVEAVVRIVFRQQRRHIDVQPQQIPDRVLVLGPIQPLQPVGPPRIGRRRGGPVQRGLQVRHQRLVGRLVGPRSARGRHEPRAQLERHFLPHLGVLAHAPHIQRAQRQPRRLQRVVVAAHAVACEHLLVFRHRSGAACAGLLRRSLRQGAARGGQDRQHNPREREPPMSHQILRLRTY